MMRFIERHETKFLILMLLILIVVVFHTEGQEPPIATAIDCGDGWQAIEAESPEIIEMFVLVNNRIWTMPDDSPYRDGSTRPEYTLRFNDGSEMLVTLSGFLTLRYNAVSKGLWWKHGEPDWRSRGDRNPHPDELYLLDADEAVAILEHC